VTTVGTVSMTSVTGVDDVVVVAGEAVEETTSVAGDVITSVTGEEVVVVGTTSVTGEAVVVAGTTSATGEAVVVAGTTSATGEVVVVEGTTSVSGDVVVVAGTTSVSGPTVELLGTISVTGVLETGTTSSTGAGTTTGFCLTGFVAGLTTLVFLTFGTVPPIVLTVAGAEAGFVAGVTISPSFAGSNSKSKSLDVSFLAGDADAWS
jgi:hypothetical protein